MSKLAREPCPTCGTETIHRLSVCLNCGHVAYRRIDSEIVRRKRARHRFAVGKAKFGAKFDDKVYRGVIAKQDGRAEAEGIKAAEAREGKKISGDFGRHRNATFGRGRERTKV